MNAQTQRLQLQGAAGTIEALRDDPASPALGVAVHGHSFADRAVPEDLVPGYPAALPGLILAFALVVMLSGYVSLASISAGVVERWTISWPT